MTLSATRVVGIGSCVIATALVGCGSAPENDFFSSSSKATAAGGKVSGGGNANHPTAGKGGSTGTSPAGGSPPVEGGTSSGGTEPTPPGPDFDLIDDMEDEDSQIIVSNGRNGAWFAFNDGSQGFMNPNPQNDFYMSDVGAPRSGSTKAVYVQGGNFTLWGSGVAFNLAFDAGSAVAYDVSSSNGVHFWVKADSPLVFILAVPNVDTEAQGGRCDASGQGDNACYSHFSEEIGVTTQWAEHTIRWSDLKQGAFGRRVPTFDATEVYSMNFGFSPNQAYGLWIDDVALVR